MKHTDREQELIELFITGDKHAMRRLYDEWANYLTAVCMRYIPDPDLRKDILQEALIKIYSGITSFNWRGPGSLKAWMARIVANEALQQIRREKHSIFEDRELTGAETLQAAETLSPEETVDDIPLPTLLEMISALPEGYRVVFNLYVFENMSHKEIAQTLGIKENSSASQFHRAKHLLAMQVKEWRHRHADR